jgi:hypothetical protein
MRGTTLNQSGANQGLPRWHVRIGPGPTHVCDTNPLTGKWQTTVAADRYPWEAIC